MILTKNLTEDNPNYDLYKEYVKQDLKFEKVQSYQKWDKKLI